MQRFAKEARDDAQGLHPRDGVFSRREFDWLNNKDVFRAMLDNAPFPEPIRHLCHHAIGTLGAQDDRGRLIVKRQLSNHDTLE